MKLAQEGVEKLPEQHAENLKEAMRHIRQENKDVNEKYQQVSSAYEDMILKEPNTGENRLLKTMLKKVHKKCIKAEEAYQQAMELYLQETRLPIAEPSQGSNKIEALK